MTGGGRGIGRAIAESLAGAGAAVAITSRSADELNETVRVIEKDCGRAAAYPADVTDAAQIQSAVTAIEGRSLRPCSNPEPALDQREHTAAADSRGC